MRLIDADKIGLTDFEIIMCQGDYREAFKMLLDKINNQATVYDIDKVIDELEIERKTANNTYNSFNMDIDLGRVFGLEKSIEIVKRGSDGIETKTIRDKATEWNNHSSKKVPYEFIDFVEGKREICVTDDVCEWKKCSSGSVDFYVYSSKCLTKNIKEIGTTTNFIDDWK